jgi:DNA-directed RNA polymerase specialized sigma24 family protein
MSADAGWPAPERALAIHARLAAGEPVAPSDLAHAFLDPLAVSLARSNPGLDPHLCDEAAEDAILALIKNPRSYDPERAALDVYLRMSARGDLRNILEREKRHRARSFPIDPVALPAAPRNQTLEHADPAAVVVLAEELARRAAALEAEAAPAGLTPAEMQVLTMMRQGERATTAFARALGVDHLPSAEQRREVKRAKDRITKRLKRSRGKYEPAD